MQRLTQQASVRITYFMDEMALPNSNDMKAKLPEGNKNFDHNYRLKNLKSSLKLAYKTVKKANMRSHLNNKRLYNQKAKLRSFQIGDSLPVRYR